ncbi:unnamed protein product [Adineta steineri]|uniref:ADP ribosyltransferase domain-containing protein n=1 Tax=Adineta steineri TaxID=433720 RepID=A0A816E9M7_9BILA|nr:unnamed protein product [Adineta steineri]CAF1644824.1 unnamed protein product [Adineta steineri]
MATSNLSTDELHTFISDQELEIFCIVWLDNYTDNTDSRHTEQQLRSVINRLKKFQDVQQCKTYIEERSPTDRLIMIVSGRLGREIVPLIQKVLQVISIYVYCMDKEGNKEWSSKFAKVKAVVVDLDELVTRIKADHRIQKNVEEPLSLNFFTTGKSVGGINGKFVYSQVLINCLLRLKSTQIDKKELIQICKDVYKGNNFELSNIREFEQQYLSDKALWWYTRETFFYKTLNAVLRNEKIHIIFLFRTFIFDIQHQLQRNQVQSCVQVYRGQVISSDELENLKKSIGQYISANSFVSTTTDPQQARRFLNMPDSTGKLELVLFEINADPRVVTTKPFADISKFSEFPDESEILFMIGSIFRVNSINRSDDDQVWIIRMELCSENTNVFEEVLADMKKEYCNEATNFHTLGKLLWEMNELDLAEKYFTRFLEQLSSNDPLLGDLYQDLAKIAAQSKKMDKSMEWRQKAIAFKKQNQLSNTKSNEQIKWKQYGVISVGGNGQGDRLNQLSHPSGIFIDHHNNIFIGDCWNNRIVEWKCHSNKGQIIAGGNGEGDKNDQLFCPTDVLIDQKNNSLIISDSNNRRIIQWFRQNDIKQQVLISDINCLGLSMDKNGFIYISDEEKNEVRRWKKGDERGTIVAGGNGKGNHLSQLNGPSFIFVDKDDSLYISDEKNHRVMKWRKNAKEGIVVAGGNGEGSTLKQLSHPQGVIVDHLGQIYVADLGNDRVMCWCEGNAEGAVVVGGNGKGEELNQLNCPTGLSFDDKENLYVVEEANHRILKYEKCFD